MTTTRTDPPARGGEALLGLMALAVIVGTAAIAGVCVLGSWWLLPVGVFAIIALAVVVAYALVHLMSENDLRAPQLPVREPTARPEPVPAPRALVSH